MAPITITFVIHLHVSLLLVSSSISQMLLDWSVSLSSSGLHLTLANYIVSIDDPGYHGKESNIFTDTTIQPCDFNYKYIHRHIFFLLLWLYSLSLCLSVSLSNIDCNVDAFRTDIIVTCPTISSTILHSIESSTKQLRHRETVATRSQALRDSYSRSPLSNCAQSKVAPMLELRCDNRNSPSLRETFHFPYQRFSLGSLGLRVPTRFTLLLYLFLVGKFLKEFTLRYDYIMKVENRSQSP